MKKLSGRKILGVFIFCFVSIVVCGILPATKRNDLTLGLLQSDTSSNIYIISISTENQPFQATSNAVSKQHCVVYTPHNNNTCAFVAQVHFFSKSKFKYNLATPVPQVQVATYQLLTLFTNMLQQVLKDRSANMLRLVINRVYGRSALAFHSKWLASGLFNSLQFTSLTRSL